MKSGPSGPLFKFTSYDRRSGGGALARFLARLHRRPGIKALGIHVAIDEFDHRARCRVAMAETRLENPRIAAIALGIALGQHIEELLDLGLIADLGDRLATCREIALLAERYHLLDHRTQILGLWQRANDLLMLDQRCRQIGEHRLPV